MARSKQAPAPKPADNRYTRAFAVLAADNKIPVEQIATKADISDRVARSCIEIWNAAINALDSRAALAIAPDLLLHAAPDKPQTGFSRAIRVLATEGELTVSDLAAKAHVSETLAKRAADTYREVIAAQRTA